MHILDESVRSDAQRTITVRLRFGAPVSSKLHYCEQTAVLTNTEGMR